MAYQPAQFPSLNNLGPQCICRYPKEGLSGISVGDLTLYPGKGIFSRFCGVISGDLIKSKNFDHLKGRKACAHWILG